MTARSWRAKWYLAFVLLVAPAVVFGQAGMMGDEPEMRDDAGTRAYGGYGMAPGMMGPGMGMMGNAESGWRPGMMGPRFGMGPGMMGQGYGMGPGMMGQGYGMGPGMMGPGMMGQGPGMMSPGMMGPNFEAAAGWHPLAALDLSEQQRSQINAIRRQSTEQQAKLYGELIGQQAKLRGLYLEDRPDPKQIGEAYAGIVGLQQRLAEAGAETQKRMLEVLTPEQRQQLQQWRRQMLGAAPQNQGGRGETSNR
jgi:Spy/CpxP family protein refolding chaperone